MTASSETIHARTLSGRTILLATDGSEASVAAAHVALGLQEVHGAVVHVIRVVDTRSAPIPPMLDLAVALADAVGGAAVHERQEVEIRAALSRATGITVEWPVRLALGTPASAIAREAHHAHAALIVMGLRRHGRLERAVHDETTLNVMRSALCPVLGVVAGTIGLPRRVLAATDFSASSMIAARAAQEMAADGATVTLAYVAPLTAFLPEEGEGLIHKLGVEAAFKTTIGNLAMGDVTYEHVVLHREQPANPADLLLECADAAKADLITAGRARHRLLDRLMMGSVSRDIVRDGRRSVLVVPPSAAPVQ